jgi:monoterpene epsilon-lactone hydrolase
MKPSYQSKLIAYMLKMLNFKKRIEEKVNKALPRSKKGFVPQRIKRSYLTNIQTSHSKQLATFESKEHVSKNHIIFFHGGLYLFEATPNHWRLAEKIVKKSFCRMTLIDYPLAPEHNYKDTFKQVSSSYEMLVEQYPEDNIILMGDSAGGGLALAFTQKLIKENHEKLPVKIVLISPWLDISMSNPTIKNLESSDHILTVTMLRNAGMKYSKGDRPDHYLLSPINGELKNIPETIVFYGTEELLNADCNRFKSLAASNMHSIIFKEYQKMQHDWVIFPIPESNQVVNEICEFIHER